MHGASTPQDAVNPSRPAPGTAPPSSGGQRSELPSGCRQDANPIEVGMASIWHNAPLSNVSRPFRALFLFCCPPPAHVDAHTELAPPAARGSRA